MAYVLGQYSKTAGDDSQFMTLITNGTVKRKSATSDTGSQGSGIEFQNECIQVGTSFNNNSNYYFHGKIKRMNTSQVFTIKLVNYSSDDKEQYIKKITVGSGDPHEWVDVEFIFTPYTTFDTILFELQRTAEDYSDEVRFPHIIYEEISVINNMITKKIGGNIQLLKIGVQSNPGVLMCINGEEIRTSKSGVYELRDDMITVSFFSIVSGAQEDTDILETRISEINIQWDVANSLPTASQRQAAKEAIQSESILNTSKTRVIDNFVLDYLYKED